MWLLGLPPGGGAAHLFRGWADRLPAAIGVGAFELPRHGSRSGEHAATSVPALVEEFARDVAPLLVRPVVLFGHSMGAILALDLVRALRAARGWQPTALIAAASEPPEPQPAGAEVPDELLAAQLSAWGGTAADLLADPEYRDEVLQVLRGDFALMSSRERRDEPPLACPVHVYLGAEDHAVDPEDARVGWARETSAGHEVRVFPGGHFFFQECEEQVLDALLDDVEAAIGAQLPRARRGADIPTTAATPAHRGAW